ncbi:MAG: hypothetical protein KC591_14035 [Gemmatimonadetes bacterium]|nr:hypothetical protein [Gemmatimonadota bacterium]
MRITRLAVTFAVLAFSIGCQDKIAAPTQGFIAIDTGGVSGADVYLDGEFQGSGLDELGPLPAGTYAVRLERTDYEVDPATDLTVTVVPAEHVTARFRLEAIAFGSIAVVARDEVTGEEVTGIAISRETSPGTFESTGFTTPATIDHLPTGPTKIRLASAGLAPGSAVPYAAVGDLSVNVVRDEVADLAVELAPERAVLGEMFTYSLCPNCPPSAEKLQEMYADHAGEMFVIEWHTWSILPLYDARWKVRERFYSGCPESDASCPGWPATVMHGGDGDAPALMIGSNDATLLEYDRRFEARQTACDPLSCPVVLRWVATDVSSGTAWIKWRSAISADPLTLNAVLLENDIETATELGGPGNQPFFEFAAREIQTVSVSRQDGTIQSFPIDLGAPGSANPHTVVVFLQSEATHEIVAVSGTR